MSETADRVARKWFTLGVLVGLVTAFLITMVFEQWGSRLGILSGIIMIALLVPMVGIQRWLYVRDKSSSPPERQA